MIERRHDERDTCESEEHRNTTEQGQCSLRALYNVTIFLAVISRLSGLSLNAASSVVDKSETTRQMPKEVTRKRKGRANRQRHGE
jgi:hypothetical protein